MPKTAAAAAAAPAPVSLEALLGLLVCWAPLPLPLGLPVCEGEAVEDSSWGVADAGGYAEPTGLTSNGCEVA